MKRKHVTILMVVMLGMTLVLAACGGGGGGGTAPQNSSGGPSTVTAQSNVPEGDPHCPYGGVQLDYGIDDNANGVLDSSEIDGTEYICNGAPGGNGQTALINTTALLVGDANCPNGGYQVDSGLDTDASGTLDPTEITSTSYLCNEIYTPLVANAISSTQIDLDWSALTGDPTVALWDVYQNGVRVTTVYDNSSTTYSVEGLTADTMYCFTVVGLDASSNAVATSPEECATTSGWHAVWTTMEDLESLYYLYYTARFYHTAVWTGSEMIIWGGYDGSNIFSDGARYDPSSGTNGSWSEISRIGPPSARYYHTAVWTGSEMLVWGGYDGTKRLNTGGIYDPAADTWNPITTTGAPPSARDNHTAVWTGSEMIIWGGYDGTKRLNTGGIYDPAADTWNPITTIDAPWARSSHKAVWTGTKMIVWGGHDGTTRLNTGGIYDPATDTWSPITTIGAPSARASHTVVWTGNRMIVWGGYDGTNEVNTGGIYDPASDTWSPITTTGAPSARAVHTAVWTGGTMIVWGGFDGSSFGDGAMYYPSTDTWMTIATNGGPATARNGHTAVWTGSEMLVWGGRETFFTNPLGDGARYAP